MNETDTQTLSCGCLVDRYQLLISCSAEHDPYEEGREGRGADQVSYRPAVSTITRDQYERFMPRQARPWCLPCRREGSRVHAQFLGIACEWHWGCLSESDQAAMIEMVRRRHSRGGRVRTHIEQIVVVRMDLRTGDVPNTVERRWQEDWDENVAPYESASSSVEEGAE